VSNRLFLATRKGLFQVERNQHSWTINAGHFVGDNVTLVLPDSRNGYLYAALDHGHFGAKLHRSTDGGTTWQECAAPTYPPKPEELNDTDFWGKPLPWKLIRIWSLETGGESQTGHLWCGTIPGGLFRSTDNGDSWNMVDSLWNHPQRKSWFGGGADYPGIHSICVHPRDNRCLAVGVSCGGVWLTTDGGNSWSCRSDGMWAAYMPPERRNDPDIQDVHRLVQCPTLPAAFWVQHHNGIFRSTDGAESWQEVKDVQPSTFGFAVAVHPRDPDTAWFVPARSDEKRILVDSKVVVTRTRDGGQTFDILHEGLPQNHAYDLTYRHGLDVDATGNRLAFGSTTGSCWISENQGDSWICLSQSLPPIHAVRFA
jgi:hypothetical protein